MRYLLLIGVLSLPILVGSGSRSTAGSRAHSYTPPVRQDVYCLQGRSWGYPGICQFSTYDQCMATASIHTPIAASIRSTLSNSKEDNRANVNQNCWYAKRRI